MHHLVTIDLKDANVELFEVYEATVLPLLQKHGAKLEMRVRAVDGSTETHLLSFPDAQSYEAYLQDPKRLNARHIWESSGARANSIEVDTLI